VTDQPGIEDLLRPLAPQVLGSLVRRYGMFDLCEDAVQEALIAAVTQWPSQGVPEQPRSWLLTVASRRLIDEIRSESARRAREDRSAEPDPSDQSSSPPPAEDDTLLLLFLCCHPALSPPSQLALTLRAVGGLTTAEIAAAFLVPEATMAQRISRAKQTVRQAGARFERPAPERLEERLRVVLHVLYLIFTEGHTSTHGDAVNRPDLTTEAIRLTREVQQRSADPEVAGLLALMLLTEARRPARTSADGQLVPLAEQDRRRWNRGMTQEGITLLTATLERGEPGPYQVQAAIAAVHNEAGSTAQTDWPQVLGLYLTLEQMAPNPMTTLNRAIALAHVRGPAEALELVDRLAQDARLAGHHRLHAVRGFLLERLDRRQDAAIEYREAARRTTSTPESRFLDAQGRRLEQFEE
jgi:RNA polymerase sigma factor (sigma-70 family)